MRNFCMDVLEKHLCFCIYESECSMYLRQTAKLASFWCLNCQLWTDFSPGSSALLFDFEYVNVDLVKS